jgi:hypothetical protein
MPLRCGFVLFTQFQVYGQYFPQINCLVPNPPHPNTPLWRGVQLKPQHTHHDITLNNPDNWPGHTFPWITLNSTLICRIQRRDFITPKGTAQPSSSFGAPHGFFLWTGFPVVSLSIFNLLLASVSSKFQSEVPSLKASIVVDCFLPVWVFK